MIDFTNPAAWNWTKSIIKDNLVTEAKGAGWMHDFGEYMPFDAVLFDGSDPMVAHNQYALQWAQVVEEALSEVDGGDDIIPFMRAATALSPAHTRLFWMGDQLVDYDNFDGMQSAMIGLLNSGLSGFTMGHSDLGGYTAVKTPVGFLDYIRTNELLNRWIEMSTFSDVIMRSHPSNLPDDCAQVYDSTANVLFLKKFTDIHVEMQHYKMSLMEEANTLGTPVTRPLMLHYPDCEAARKVTDQFMLGRDVLVAPIFAAGQSNREVFLPGPDTWVHLWSKLRYTAGAEGRTLAFTAILGQPPVFVRQTEENDAVMWAEKLAPTAQFLFLE